MLCGQILLKTYLEHEHWWSPAAGDSSQQAATSEKHCGFLLMDIKWNANIDSATNTFGDMSSHCTSVKLVHSVNSGKVLNFNGMTVSIRKHTLYMVTTDMAIMRSILFYCLCTATGVKMVWTSERLAFKGHSANSISNDSTSTFQ